MRFKTKTVELSAADILALNATTYDGPPLVPAPSAGQMIVPVAILTIYRFGSTPYVIDGNNDLYVSTEVEYSSPNGGSWFKLARNGGLGLAADSAVISGPEEFDDDVQLAGVDGQPLGLFVNEPYTDGDGSLEVTTTYRLVATA